MVWCSHLLKNFAQFVVIHTVKYVILTYMTKDLDKILLNLSNIIVFTSVIFSFSVTGFVYHVQSSVMMLLHLDFYYIFMLLQIYILNSILQINFKLNSFGNPVALI